MASGLVAAARQFPDRAGIVARDLVWSLAEMEERVSALAARLLDERADDRGTGAWVPIVVDRSPDSVVAILAVIRAGLKFSAIESTAPPERVAEHWHRLGGPDRAVVAHAGLRTRVPSGVRVTVGDDCGTGAVPPRPVVSDAPAAVVFTSGSTGRAKGVVLSWAAFDERHASASRDGPDPADRNWPEACIQPFGFAAGLRRLAAPGIGRTLCVADPATMSVDELLGWLDRVGVATVGFPPSLGATVVKAAGDRPRLPTVELLRSGAEATSWELVPALRRLVGPDCPLRTGFAASEVGQVLAHLVGPDDPVGAGRVPLGRVQPGMRVQLDPIEGDPTRTELVIAAPTSLGYLGDPDLTARRYVTDDEGLRWWRSGDIVSVDAAGIHHHRARVDDMVKINGMLVEPREAEEVLRRIPGIGAAAVLPQRMPSGLTRLVAHLRVDAAELEPDDVRRELTDRLPVQLVPAVLVRHDDLPVTERGKLDRAALTATPLRRWRTTASSDADTDFERALLPVVWRLLGDDVGPDDDLWEMGLDSLGALELCAALAELGSDVAPSVLLGSRSVAALAGTATERAGTGSTTAVRFNPTGTRRPVYVAPGGGNTALYFRFLADALGPDRPLVVIEPRGMHRPEPPDRTVAAIAAHLRDEIVVDAGPDEPVVVLGYSSGAPMAFEAGRLLHAEGRAVHLVMLDAAPAGRPAEAVVIDRRHTDAVAPRSGGVARRVAVVGAFVRYHWHRQRTVHHRRPWEVPGAARAWWRARRVREAQLARVAAFVHDPGPPRSDPDRYTAFLMIAGSAWRRYEAAPLPVPMSVVRVADNPAEERCRALTDRLDVHVVGGDHRTIVEPPFVHETAEALASITDAAFGGGVAGVD
jgi:acyl-coenzyme A synthetase/AMP-(fatty) acid ligase/thioesterase domain-containing protein/aryl carrier-like protein